MKFKTSTLLLIGMLIISSCTQKQNNKEGHAYKALIIKANEEMLNKGNADFADEVFSSDYQGQGPEVIKAIVNKLRTAFPDLKVEIDLFVEDGHMIAWRRTHTGTQQGEYLGYPPSGKKISWEDIVISRYDGGKVAEEWGTSNLVEVLQSNRPASD